ncbi:hypothetical protein H310_06491 [Aphanomyces invadans]|uniref:DUF6817 domain-containing protein n=1 Tax=Aphanomyces invadans TaxID=157072 RepID=A0A024U7W2_9STRA|nr:hypothetical protein H310_06491 [Aphanomyces invadans]ETW01962.1 hypothetical protein H310_06491 [Aphanomyces invadans]|eukprot:XP_008869810.1 hypothetical protein H310_06491 [Aphanomyces invadans]
MRLTTSLGVVAKSHVIDTWKAKTFAADPARTASWKSMDVKLRKFLKASVPEALAHTGDAAFDEHLVGVQSVLRTFGADEEVCTAGLFHSLYGTEGFQGFKMPILRRPEIRRLIGPRAEQLVWSFCVVDRKVFDDALLLRPDSVGHEPPQLLARPELGRFPLPPATSTNEWLDFVELVLADWVDQVAGAAEKANPLFDWQKGEAWSYRRHAYAKMAELLAIHRPENDRGPRIQRIVHEVYAAEPIATRELVQEVTPPMSDAAKEARDAMRSVLL